MSRSRYSQRLRFIQKICLNNTDLYHELIDGPHGNQHRAIRHTVHPTKHPVQSSASAPAMRIEAATPNVV
jgi:hypothetical protein